MRASPAVFRAVRVSARRALVDLGTYPLPAGNMFPRAAKTETLPVTALPAWFGHQEVPDSVIGKPVNEK